MLPAALGSRAGAGGRRTSWLTHPVPMLSFHPADRSFPWEKPQDLPCFPPDPTQPPACNVHQCLNPAAPGDFGASLKLRSCLSAFLNKNFSILPKSACRAGTALLLGPLLKGWEREGSCALGWERKRLGTLPPSLLHPAGAGASF